MRRRAVLCGGGTPATPAKRGTIASFAVHRAARRAGFTLLEMLVALGLMGILATVLGVSLRTGFKARATAEAALGPARAAAIALEILRREIASALPPTGILAGAFYGEDSPTSAGDRDADFVEFYALSESGGRAAPGIRKIVFALAASPEGEGDVLVRRETANLLAPTVSEPTEEILCREVLSLNLRYYDGSAWQDSWDSGARGNVLPLLVEARIVVRGLYGVGEYSMVRAFPLPCGATSETQEEAVSLF